MRLLSTAEDMQIKVWDLVINSEMASLRAHTSMVTSLVFSTDCSMMVSGGRDGQIALWNANDSFKPLL
jgi:WD40 repeat protein